MASKTTYLKLEKPNLRSTNWGASLNNNFDKLDTKAESIDNNIKGIKKSLGESNIFSVDEEYPYICFSRNGDSYTIDRRTTTTGDKKSLIFEYNGGVVINSLNSIADFTAYYVAAKYEVPEELPTEMLNWMKAIFGTSWDLGEMAVKSTQWDTSSTSTEPYITKYKQVFGGWYEPIRVGRDASNNITNTITWEKKFAEEAPKSVETVIPFRTLNTATYMARIDNLSYPGMTSDSTYNNFEHNEKYSYDPEFESFVRGAWREMKIDFMVISVGDEEDTITPISIDWSVKDNYHSESHQYYISWNKTVPENAWIRITVSTAPESEGA